MGASNEELIRTAVCKMAGFEVGDATWSDMYARAKRKLRHIVTLFGDADGARNEPRYIAQLVIEAMRAQAFTDYTFERYGRKKRGAGTNADPRGHDLILP